jgi:hypothetical protein
MDGDDVVVLCTGEELVVELIPIEDPSIAKPEPGSKRDVLLVAVSLVTEEIVVDKLVTEELVPAVVESPLLVEEGDIEEEEDVDDDKEEDEGKEDEEEKDK